MANSLLTATQVTREALRILHEKLSFVGNINRQYDDSFAQSGAKIGDSLKIRLPNQYTVRTGATLSAQDTAETSTTLQVATQKGVDMSFTSVDLTMSIDDFKKRILEPAMAVLAANIEADALSMYKDVHNEVSNVGAAITFADVLNAGRKLTDNLAPMDNRCLLLTTENNVDLVSNTSTLFNDRTKVGDQYKKGLMGNDFLGFDCVYQNTLMPTHTTGTDDGTGDYLVNGASQTGSTLTVDTGTGSFAAGDIIEIDGVFSVHPETKQATGVLKQFVVTAASGTSATALSISPAITISGASQNVSAAPADNAQVFKRESDSTTAIGASADYKLGMAFHKDAFAFASADLQMPKGVDFAARDVFEGISMRVVRQYDINADAFPTRLDVLYGYKAIRPEIACRLGFN
ncbi:MAG: P22 phage major capsid protein family protein [Rhodospirillaceae bacterium]